MVLRDFLKDHRRLKGGCYQEVVMGTSESFQETLRRFIEGYLEVLKRSSSRKVLKKLMGPLKKFWSFL